MTLFSTVTFGTCANYPMVSGIRRGDDLQIRPGIGWCRVTDVSSTGLRFRRRLRWSWTESLVRWFEDSLLFPLLDWDEQHRDQ